MNICAIIPAAGSGSRAGFEKNKILQNLNGIPVLLRTVSAFERNAEISKIVVCISEPDRSAVETILANCRKVVLTVGGSTRTQTVQNALEYLAEAPEPPDYVLIHDAARPFVTQKIIEDCIQTVRANGSAICSVPCTDTAVTAHFGLIEGKLDRESTFLVQTPQGFAFNELLCAYRKIQPDELFTDDSGVFAKYCAPPKLFQGDRKNIKLTFREDFMQDELRTGIGIDTHAFGKDCDFITLGGVRIPSDTGLLAHSDGDVLCHALSDALLSAAGLLDIGQYFPDTDPQYKDADSMQLLARVVQLIQREGFQPVNASVAIVAERPKMAAYIPKMKQNLAYVLQISERNIGISAGTNEKLGYLGRGEGITVTANVLLKTRM